MALLDRPDWEITVTTVFCDAVEDEVTLMVYSDGMSRCTGRDKYSKSEKDTARMRNKNRQGKTPGCTEDDCPRVKQYRDKVFKG